MIDHSVLCEGRAVGKEPLGNNLDDISFGSLSDSDFAGISDLITRMSTDSDQRLRDKSPAYYRWMYEANPAGRAIVHSARHHDAVVSSFAIAPKIIQIDGRKTVIGKTMDMFTDPAYQGKGLIKRCTDAVFREAKSSGMDGWYVTPSVNSYPIFKEKWEYREDLHLIYRARILDYSEVVPAVIKPPWLGRAVGVVADAALKVLPKRAAGLAHRCETVTIDRFGAEADELWAKVADGYKVALVRDAAYLNWRYIDNPDNYWVIGLSHLGKLIGLMVLTTTVRRGITVGEIMDYVCAVDDRATFNELIRLALADFEQRGCALAQAWSIKGTNRDDRMKKAGLSLERTDVKFLISPHYSSPTIYDPEAWLLTQGDGNDV